MIHKLEGEIKLEKEDVLKTTLEELIEDFIFNKGSKSETI